MQPQEVAANPNLTPPPVFTTPPPMQPLGSAPGNMASNANVPSLLGVSAVDERPQMVTEGIQTSTVSGVPGAGKLIGDIEAAGKKELEAQEKIGKNRAEAAGDLRALRESGLADERKLEAKRMAAEAQRSKELMESEASINAAAEEAKAMRVDPNKFYNDRGTLGTILAALSVGAGAYASAMTGTRNFALDIIENAISRDIDAQKEAIAGKRADVAEKRNLFQMMRQRFGDDRQAEEAAKINMRQSIIDQLENTKANYDAKGIPFTNDKELAALQKKNAEDKFNLVKESSSKTTTVVSKRMATKGGAGKPLESGKEVDKIDELASIKRDVAKLDEMLDNIDSGKVDVGRISGVANKMREWLLNNPDKDWATARADQRVNMIKSAKTTFGSSQLSNKDMDIMAQAMPNEWDSPEVFTSMLRSQRDSAASSHQDKFSILENAGVAPNKLAPFRLKPTQKELQAK
jgi:hypothetical protein